jgi:hypothetical protein
LVEIEVDKPSHSKPQKPMVKLHAIASRKGKEIAPPSAVTDIAESVSDEFDEFDDLTAMESADSILNR